MNQGSNSNQKINPQGAAVPEEEKLEFLKREEIRTMQKDVIRLREGEAQTERERITELKPQEPRKEIPVRLPAKEEKRESGPMEKGMPVTLIPRELPKKLSPLQKIIVRAGVVLILLLFAGFFYWLIAQKPSEAPGEEETTLPEETAEEPGEQPGEQPEEQPEIKVPLSLISTEATRTLEIINLGETPLILSGLLKGKVEPQGFTRVLIENKNENKILGLKDFFAAFETQSPEGLLDKLDDDFTLFVYSTQAANRLGFVAKVEQTEGLLNLLKTWEETMEKDMKKLFVSLGQEEPTLVSYFRDGVWKNTTYRYLTISKADLGICYSIFDNYFIFTSSWKSLAEVIDNLLEAKEEISPPEEVTEGPEIAIPSIIERILTWGYHFPTVSRTIDTIVIHSAYNAIGGDVHDMEKVIEEFRTHKATSHYLIARDGTIYRLAPDEAVAYHAGVSRMPDGSRVNVINNFSIGIELIYTNTESPNETQYQTAAQLTKYLVKQYDITFENILGHNEIAPERKTDPWNFDWEYFRILLKQ